MQSGSIYVAVQGTTCAQGLQCPGKGSLVDTEHVSLEVCLVISDGPISPESTHQAADHSTKRALEVRPLTYIKSLSSPS